MVGRFLQSVTVSVNLVTSVLRPPLKRNHIVSWQYQILPVMSSDSLSVDRRPRLVGRLPWLQGSVCRGRLIQGATVERRSVGGFSSLCFLVEYEDQGC